MADEVKAPSTHEAASQLLSTLATEAFDNTGGDRWNAGQPLVPPSVATEKGPAEAAPASEEGSTPSPAKDEPKPAEITVSEAEKIVLAELGPLAGKYNSLAELKKGLHEVYAERKAEATPAPAPTEADPLDELQMFGLPKEPLAKALDAVVERKLGERQQAAATAAKVRYDADRAVIAKYPEYEKRFDELSTFIQSDPALQERVLEAENAGYHLLAREYAWLQFAASEASRGEGEIKEKAEAQKVERTSRRADARTMPSKQTEAPKLEPGQLPEKPQVTKDEFDRLKALAKEGYETPLWRRMIGDHLPKEIFPDTV